MALIVIIDHCLGKRQGQRQVLTQERVTFGRHPDNDICFDANIDIQASSRHAEVVLEDLNGAFILKDVGSSNGTRIAGEVVKRKTLQYGETYEVEFGKGGPVVRIWVGEEADSLKLSPITLPKVCWWVLPWKI